MLLKPILHGRALNLILQGWEVIFLPIGFCSMQRLKATKIFIFNTNKTNDEAKLFEAYRIGDRTEELQIHEIGSYSDNGFQTLTKTFIWERRKDLKGYEFSVVALPNEPFLNFQNNVSIFSKL